MIVSALVIDTVIRQALADLHALSKVVDNKHAEVSTKYERLLRRDAHDEHVMQLFGVLLRLTYERNRCECSPFCGMNSQRESVIPRPEVIPYWQPNLI